MLLGTSNLQAHGPSTPKLTGRGDGGSTGLKEGPPRGAGGVVDTRGRLDERPSPRPAEGPPTTSEDHTETETLVVVVASLGWEGGGCGRAE